MSIIYVDWPDCWISIIQICQTMKKLTKMITRMYLLKISGILFILLTTLTRMNLSAQPGLLAYADAGENNVSEGLFIRSALLGHYRSGKNQLEAGVQTNLMNGNNIVLSGYCINGSREFRIKNTVLELNGFWLWSASSELLKATNYGCFIAMKQKHFEIQIGTNFRTLGFRKHAIEEYHIAKDATKVHENFNLMYSFSYNLKPSDSRWNTGLTLTNTDYFLINQETNPFINLHGSYHVSSPVCLFAEVWYKNAGSLNMSTNYFGFVIRGGVKWNF
jgi:hypothetical protein